jgi:hypothetical protein
VTIQQHAKDRPSLAKRVTAAGGLALAGISAAVVMNAAPAMASWQAASIGNSDVSLRDCYHPSKAAQPSQSCTFIKYVPAGTTVHIVCQHSGQDIYGDAVWDYISYSGGEGYVADSYVYTGYTNWIPGVDVCSY